MRPRSRHIALGGRASLIAAATLLGVIYAGSTILTPYSSFRPRRSGFEMRAFDRKHGKE